MVTTVDITKAFAIDGWMSERELSWLAERAVEHSRIVEIGSYLGRSTRALLDHTPGVVYAFDDWKGPRDVYLEKAERQTLFSRFCLNIQDHIDSGKVRIGIGDFADIQFDGKADMVFLDGSHEYEDVKRDLLFWKDRLAPGGLLCGHDANWVGVQRAVQEILGGVQVANDTTIWWKLVYGI